ncbi:MAG: hypothetical protein KDE47_24350, partial [Caldilineaceae bacterium]|nr:hypothetical protein [Caldilineaceae bacterium]
MNSLYELPERRRRSSARLMVLMVSTVLLWVAAIALILMACAIPASWVSAVREPQREPTPASIFDTTFAPETDMTGQNLPRLTAGPVLPCPTTAPA